jgi:hypothetical protein
MKGSGGFSALSTSKGGFTVWANEELESRTSNDTTSEITNFTDVDSFQQNYGQIHEQTDGAA